MTAASGAYVARQEEEAKVLHHVEEVRESRRSRALLLHGPGGADKTMLVRHLAAQAGPAGDDVVWVPPIDVGMRAVAEDTADGDGMLDASDLAPSGQLVYAQWAPAADGAPARQQRPTQPAPADSLPRSRARRRSSRRPRWRPAPRRWGGRSSRSRS
jgi:hypothetical protein